MRKALLAVPAVLACVAAVVLLRGCEGSLTFKDVYQARSWVAAQNLRHHPLHQPCESGLWVTENPDVDLSAISTLRVPPGVVQILPAEKLREDILTFDPSKSRRWGNVVAWGDEELLDRLEGLRKRADE
jgi:hypothetical protein